jgi:DNA polymerase-3 subunit gamma/tau
VDQVRSMLGLADRGRVLDLFDMILRGDAAGALTELSAQYADGADPMAVLRDLAEIAHWVSVIKVTPDAAQDPTVSPDERTRGLAMAAALPMRVLGRMWQMLLKALEEVAHAPNAMMAAEMAVIRLTHVADLPTPEELVRKLQEMPAPGPSGGGGGGAGGAAPRSSPPQTRMAGPSASGQSGHSGHSGPTAALAMASDPASALARFSRFEDVVDLIRHHRDVKLLIEVETGLKLARYSPGRIEFEPARGAPADLAQRLGSRLQAWTGNRWAVTVVNNGGAQTLAETRDTAAEALRAEAEDHPLVQAVMLAFPKARIMAIHTPADKAVEAEVEALPEVSDEWDPFEDD